MKTLKEQEAVDYLDRAAGAISGSELALPQLYLLRSMLRLHSAYFYRLMRTDRQDLVVVQIAKNGFPELSSWYADVSASIAEYESLKTNRAKKLRIVLDNLTDPTSEQYLQKVEKLGHEFESENPLTEEINRLSDRRINYLASLKDLGSSSLPFYCSDEQPGMLICRMTSTPFGDLKKEEKGVKIDYPNLGLKYLDFQKKEEEGETPSFYPSVILTTATNKEQPFALVINRRSEIIFNQDSRYFSKHDKTVHVPFTTAYKVIGQYTWPEHNISVFYPALLKEFLMLDFPNLSYEESVQIITGFKKLTSHIIDLESIYNSVLVGRAVNSEDFMARHRRLADYYKELLDSLNSDELKASLQIAFRESAAILKNKAEDFLKNNNSAQNSASPENKPKPGKVGRFVVGNLYKWLDKNL